MEVHGGVQDGTMILVTFQAPTATLRVHGSPLFRRPLRPFRLLGTIGAFEGSLGLAWEVPVEQRSHSLYDRRPTRG